MSRIESVEQLRTIYRQPKELAAKKVIPRLEAHSKRIIALSPFLVISTLGEDGIADVSPRGDAPALLRATAAPASARRRAALMGGGVLLFALLLVFLGPSELDL